MNNQEIIYRMCYKCRKETPHQIYKINLLRGVKLRCLSCGRFLTNYINLKTLQGGTSKNGKRIYN